MANKITTSADLRDVQRAFKALEPAFRHELTLATEATSQAVVAAARRFVPVRYGFLRDFIVYKVNPRTGFGVAGIKGGKAAIPGSPTNSASQYPSVYGVFVHEGTKYIEPNAFMTKAAEENRAPAAQHVKDACTRAGGELHRMWLAAAASRKAAA
jgi:hypothetical protein